MEALVILLVTTVIMAVALPLITVKKQIGLGEKWSYANGNNISLGDEKGSNNVGLGTATPLAKLHVVSSRPYLPLVADAAAPSATSTQKGPDVILQARRDVAMLAFRNITQGRVQRLYFNLNNDNIGMGENVFNASVNPGADNIAIGDMSLSGLTSGSNNIAIGHNALANLRTGSGNVALGGFALNNCANISDNVAIVFHGPGPNGNTGGNAICGDANVFVGRNAGGGNGTGNNNVFIGDRAGQNATGSRNVIIGNSISSGGSSDTLNIANVITGTMGPNPADERLHINARITSSRIACRTYAPVSDVRLKENIKPYKRGIDDLSKVETYRFHYKTDKKGDPENVGIIAQDLVKIIPEAVSTNKDGKYVVDYNYLNMAMVNSIKDLKKENDELNAELDLLEKQIDSPCVCNVKKAPKTFWDKVLNFIRFK